MSSTNRTRSLALGGESQQELDAMQRRDAMQHDATYAAAIHRLWSIFDKDDQGHVHKEGYLRGLSNYCQVLMPHLPMEEAIELATNDWEEDVGHFSTDGSTLDFDGFYLAMSELTDLWCPVTDSDDYSAFVDSLFKRATVRVVHDANGAVVRRDVARSEYIFIEDLPTSMLRAVVEEDVSQEVVVVAADEKEEEEEEEEEAENSAAVKMQAVQRGRSSRKIARDKWLESLSVKFNPKGLDLRRAATKQKEKAAAKMQAVTRGRNGRKKAAAKAQEVEKREQDKAAQRMQAVSRGRAAREQVRVKKMQQQYAQLIPPGLDLRRPSKKRKELDEQQTKSALLMQGLARQRNARVAVQDKRDQRNAAVRMQNIQRGRIARKRVDNIREEKKQSEQPKTITPPASPDSSLQIDLRRPSTKKKDAMSRFEIKPGTFHEIVDYDNNIGVDDATMISYEWATEEEILFMQEQSENARPPLLLKEQSISPMWENPSGEHFAEHAHPLIKGRHHAHLRQLHKEAQREMEEVVEDSPPPNAPSASEAKPSIPAETNNTERSDSTAIAAALNPLGLDLRRPGHRRKRGVPKPHHHVNRFKAVARSIGRLTSLKQFVLERHILLYGTSAKNGNQKQSEEPTNPARNGGVVKPEAAKVPDIMHRAPPPTTNNTTTIDTATKRATVGIDPKNELDLDLSKALRMNDVTGAIGTQRGVWVVGMAGDACERVATHASKMLSLELITPSLILDQAIQAAKKDAEERSKNVDEEEVETAVSEEMETETAADQSSQQQNVEGVANVSLLVLVGRQLLSGTGVSQKETDSLMMDAVVRASKMSNLGYALTGYPRTVEQSMELSSALSSTFSPSEIIVLDITDSESYSLRQSKLRVDLTSGTTTTETDRTAFTTFVADKRSTILEEAKREKIAELKEQADELEEGETSPDYTKYTFEQLEIDIDALELPTLPTGPELHGGEYPVTLPLDSNESLTKKRAESHLLIPLPTPLNELPKSNIHRVDATQPMDDVLSEVAWRISGGWSTIVGFGRIGCLPTTALSFPTLPSELEHPVVEVEAPEAEAEATKEGDEEKSVAVDNGDTTDDSIGAENVSVIKNPPLTSEQIQYLLFGDVQIEETKKEGEDDNESEEVEEDGALNKFVGKFLTATGGIGTDSAQPPLRRFGWYRGYCPVSLVDQNTLCHGRPEFAAMVGGKVYVMGSSEKHVTFIANAQKYIAARPALPTTRTACIISAPFMNDAASSAASSVANRFGLRTISPKDSVAAIAIGAEGVDATSLATHMMQQCNDNSGNNANIGWVMEGCPLHSGHVSCLVEQGWNPDVVVVFAPPPPPPSIASEASEAEGDDDGATADQGKETTKMSSDETYVNPTAAFAAYEEDYSTLIETLRSSNINVVEVAACSLNDQYGNGHVVDMTGWLAQSVHPMLSRGDAVSLPDGVSMETHISFSSETGVFCPVALKDSGTCARGNGEFITHIDGVKYTFCDSRTKQQFDAFPETYVLGGEGNRLTAPMRVLVVAPIGASRYDILENVAESSRLTLISVGRDPEYIQYVENAMKPRVRIAQEDGEDVDDDAAEAEQPEMPSPETFVLPIIQRLMSGVPSTQGCVVDGDPAIFTPTVCQWMVKERLHPSTVIYCTMDPQLATDRRVPNEFTWVPPMPEEPEGGDEDEDVEPPPKLTKEELTEMEEAARAEVAAKILEETELSISACDVIVETLAELGIPEFPSRPSISVGLRLSRKRVAAAVARHANALQQAMTTGAVHSLSSIATGDEEISPEEAEASREMSMHAARSLLASGYREMSRYVTRDPVVYFNSGGTSEGDVKQLGYACTYQYCVYFCDNDKNRIAFTSNPERYLQNSGAYTPSHSSPFATVRKPPSAYIMGGPMSGKTTLSISLSREIGAIHLTPENLLQWSMLPSSIAASPACAVAHAKLTSGGAISSPRKINLGEEDDTAILLDVLRARVRRFDCVCSGWILDGFPRSAAEARSLVAFSADVAPTVVLVLDGLSHTDTMVRARTVHAQRQKNGSLDQSSSTSSVLKSLQRWIHESESMKAALSQTYLNTRRIHVGNGASGRAQSTWSVLSSVRFVLQDLSRKNASHATALALHVPAPLDGISFRSNILMSQRGHLGAYCPVRLTSEKRLIATGHGSLNQRRFGATYQGRVYSCADLVSLEKFSSNPQFYLEQTTLPNDLPLLVPLGAHLRAGASLSLAFGGYCTVTFKEGKGARDWSSIVEADPICTVRYQNATWGFANPVQKKKFMEEPHLFVNHELPLKLPPKMKPLSLAQLRSGGLHGVLAVAEQSLSIATQNALLALGENRVKFPSLNVAESAAKFVGLFLKSRNSSSSATIRQKFTAKLEEFVSECSLATYLKDNQEVLNTSTPRGSGIKAVRGMSSDQKGKVDEYMNTARKFELLCGERSEQLYERFMK